MVNLVPTNTVIETYRNIQEHTETNRNIQSEHTAIFKEGDFLLFHNFMVQSY